MDNTQAFASKLHYALKMAGFSVYELRLNPGQRGDFVVQAVLANSSKGTVEIEDAEIKKTDHRVVAIDETEARQAAK